jgi:hypothetical protein
VQFVYHVFGVGAINGIFVFGKTQMANLAMEKQQMAASIHASKEVHRLTHVRRRYFPDIFQIFYNFPLPPRSRA